ncbi:hypothetical protein BDQ12DRAFT_724522 [Crucibulum laeve]|uniref:Uncharacterized protein n=1 Tax=Crucibulum laeve TaxID=68775 RepID=A0A5C3LV45_9AGAR|nr:hypothetical protein BDQ12DRAFT_724522 [Crucibulum laeve]
MSPPLAPTTTTTIEEEVDMRIAEDIIRRIIIPFTHIPQQRLLTCTSQEPEAETPLPGLR